MENKLQDNWYIVYVKTNCEYAAKNSLDVHCIIPVIEKTIIKRGEIQSTTVPRFKNYVYVQHDGTDDFFARVGNNDYINYFVGSEKGQEPKPVDSPYVENIKERETDRNFIQPGDEIAVIDGPYKSLTGEVINKLDDNEFLIAINILGQLITEKISRNYIIRSN